MVFTTSEATLTVTVVGTFNGETGDFSSTGPVTAATAKLAGAVGTLVLEGVEDLSTGKFLEIVTGLIRRPRFMKVAFGRTDRPPIVCIR